MELCSLEDAFPKIERHDHSEKKELQATDPKTFSNREERRAARKRAKKCKGPALTYLQADDDADTTAVAPTDADRPAVKRLGEIPPFVAYAEAFPDLSGMYEGFKIDTKLNASTQHINEGLPAYFGKGVEDEEGFANYTEGENPGYRLIPETLAGFEQKNPTDLPALSLKNNWKPIASAGAKTAFIPLAESETKNNVASEAAPVPIHQADPSTAERAARDKLLEKIQDLTRRLEDLERKTPRNTQQELLMFVGAGFFILVSFDIARRLR